MSQPSQPDLRPKMSAEELHDFLVREFPQAEPEWLRVEQVSERYVRLRALIGESDLRPGGTVSTGTLSAVADTAMYLLTLATIGPEPRALASGMSVHFLRRCDKADLIVEAKLLKLGARLAVGEILIFSFGIEEVAAIATVTYSLPPHREGEPEPAHPA